MRRIFLVLFFVFGVSFQAADAAVLNFDNPEYPGKYYKLQNGAYGFNWEGIYVMNREVHPGSGYEDGLKSGNNVACSWFVDNSYMRAIGDSSFKPISGWFTSAWTEGQPLTISAYNDGKYIGEKNLKLFDSKPTLVEFDFGYIDELKFTKTGSQFAMDDLTYEMATPAPEPSSMLLGLLGAGSLFGCKRKKR